MKFMLTPIAAFGLAVAFPAVAQNAPPPPADSSAPATAPMPAPAPDSSTATPPSPPADASGPANAPMASAGDTARPEAAPSNPPVCGPGVTDRCVQSAGDERLAAKQYSDSLPHNDNAAMRGGAKKTTTKRHRR